MMMSAEECVGFEIGMILDAAEEANRDARRITDANVEVLTGYLADIQKAGFLLGDLLNKIEGLVIHHDQEQLA